jgi:hypothetical protein
LPRELPIEGEPANVCAALQSAHAVLAASTNPKLLFVGEPGALVAPALASRFAASLANCALVALGPGATFSAGGSSRGDRPFHCRLDRRHRGDHFTPDPASRLMEAK